ncbi:MAG: methyltransferase, UbiE [Rhodospirillales bacterium]|nr:methyltransferase, UbiE [Rhodospirillales bacterium]
MTQKVGLGGRAYALASTLRVAWYAGQYRVAARIDGTRLRKRPGSAMPSEAEFRADLRALFADDWAHVAAGLYPAPGNLLPSPPQAIADAVAFLREVPRVATRRRARLAGGRPERLTTDDAKLPQYYRQSFHDQTDGYLSAHSARLYDHQVEVLFVGAADAMRRQALAPIARHLSSVGARGAVLLDVACGTGAMSTQLKTAFPRTRLIALDLSLPYLHRARALLSRWTRVQTVQGAAEKLPVAEASIDAASLVFLFHELPRAVRSQVVAELARVVKPGGLVVLLDTLQTGDHQPYDALLDMFPVAFHEPYYADYIAQDLHALMRPYGFEPVEDRRVFLAKCSVFRRV